MATPPARRTYHHGDLRRALLDAGIALARDGGPDAVVLREATRRAGVVPNAAYRHFASRHALLQAVRAAALSALAVAMEKELAAAAPPADPAAFARASLRAIGTAYLRFARTEPGLFRTAFAVPARSATRWPDRGDGRQQRPQPVPAAGRGAGPSWSRRACCRPSGGPGAEYLAWSAVHGLAMLVLEGPLRQLTRTQAAGCRGGCWT